MALIPQLLTLLLAVGASHGFHNRCPSPEVISPCTCEEGYIAVGVDCNYVNDTKEVRRVLQNFNENQRVYLTFRYSHLGKVPSDLFKGVRIARLNFLECHLEEFGEKGRSAVEGLEDTLEEFSVKFSFTKDNELKFLNVSKLRVLVNLDLGWNRIEELGNEWFAEGPTSLKHISLAGNGIKRLGDRAFAQLKNLRSLFLDKNNIRTPKRSMFPSPAIHLDLLSLEGNGISTLPVDMFSRMPTLSYVQLNENSIQHLPEATWKLIWGHLTGLKIKNNPLVCDSHIDWMYELRRPQFMSGKCTSPNERKEVELAKVIDDEQNEDEY